MHFELTTFEIMQRNQRWFDLGFGFTGKGTPDQVPSSSYVGVDEQ